MQEWGALPAEILYIIFRYLHGWDIEDLERTTLQCTFVCKNWRLPALQFAYTKVRFTTEEHFNEIIDFMKNNRNSPARFVKSLFFDFYEKDEFHLDELSTLFPNVTNIHTWEASSNFYASLAQVRREGKWKGLYKLPKSYKKEDIESYVTCALEYSDTLTHLFIGDDTYLELNRQEPPENIGQYNRLLEKVEQFPCLTNLKVLNHVNGTIESLDGLIQRCPKLESFRCEIANQDGFVGDDQFEFDIGRVIQRPDITSLDLTMELTTDLSLLYIMYKFPNLQFLVINNDVDSDHALYYPLIYGTSKFNQRVLAMFLTFLGSIDNIYANHFYTSQDNLGDLLRLYWEAQNENRRRPGSLKIGYAYFEKDGDHWYDYENENSSINMSMYSVDRLPIPTPCIKHNSVGAGLPHLEIIEECGHFLNSLKFFISKDKLNFISNEKDNNKENIDLATGYCLDHLFRHCPNLNHLVLEDMNLIHCDPTNTYENKSIVKLDIKYADFHEDVLSELSARLPSLCDLELSQCSFIDSDGNDTMKTKRNISIIMDTAKLTKSLYIEPNKLQDRIFTLVNTEKFMDLCLKVSTPILGDVYYKAIFDKDQISYEKTKATQDEYTNSLENSECISIYVQCKDITKVVIQMGCYHYQIKTVEWDFYG